MSRKVAADLLDAMNHATCRISGTETLLHACCDGIPGFLPEHFVCAGIAQYDELAPGRDDEEQDGIALRRACKSLALERTLCGAPDISPKVGRNGDADRCIGRTFDVVDRLANAFLVKETMVPWLPYHLPVAPPPPERPPPPENPPPPIDPPLPRPMTVNSRNNAVDGLRTATIRNVRIARPMKISASGLNGVLISSDPVSCAGGLRDGLGPSSALPPRTPRMRSTPEMTARSGRPRRISGTMVSRIISMQPHRGEFARVRSPLRSAPCGPVEKRRRRRRRPGPYGRLSSVRMRERSNPRLASVRSSSRRRRAPDVRFVFHMCSSGHSGRQSSEAIADLRYQSPTAPAPAESERRRRQLRKRLRGALGRAERRQSLSSRYNFTCGTFCEPGCALKYDLSTNRLPKKPATSTVGNESRRIKRLGRFVEPHTFNADPVLRSLELRLQIGKVLTGLQIRVRLRNSKETR